MFNVFKFLQVLSIWIRPFELILRRLQQLTCISLGQAEIIFWKRLSEISEGQMMIFFTDLAMKAKKELMNSLWDL